MSVSPGFRVFVLEQLARVAPQIRMKSMFGGIGIYSGDLFFALIDDDQLYLKVDDSNRHDFVSLGLGPFQPMGPGTEVMQYYPLPGDILEDTDALRDWVARAIAVAAAKKRVRKPGRSR